tara:strand:- start:939 stop:1244 length:306 start_codon:yes stop_codon:yes gene_type:complete
MLLNKAIVCKDGFRMSVQANICAYCRPRENHAVAYSHVEIGFPSEKEDLIMRYMDGHGDDDPTCTVYAYVPASTVSLVLAKHGGIVSGDLPAGIPYLSART